LIELTKKRKDTLFNKGVGAMPSAVHHSINRSECRTLLACLAVGVGAYILVVIAAYHTQSAIIFGSGGLAATPPARFGIETVSIPTSDGLHLNGWWLEASGTRRTVLFFQGNRRRPADHIQRLETLVDLGVNALFFDYRGFGRTEGCIRREEDIYRDGQAAWDYLRRNRRIPAGDIILWGRSMGGAVAVEVARHRPVGLLVLESTFYALEDMARIHYRWLPTRHLLKFHFRNGEKLPDVRAPVIVIHSPEDGYVPFDQGLRLFKAAPEPKILLSTSGHHFERFEGHRIHRQQFIDHFNRLAGLGKTMVWLP
jgi:fermentation-respiration switch protein FrsA (DUF1100 family)